MSDKTRSKLILERWHSGISKDDRRHENLLSLFDSLVEDMFHAGIGFDSAYDSIKEAAKLLYPSASTVKHVFSVSPYRKNSTIQDFARIWHESIDKTSLEAFYGHYNIEGTSRSSDKKSTKVSGMQTEDALNEEDFWKSVKSVSKNSPWLFADEDK